MPYNVKLTYFKRLGKFNAEGEYTSHCEQMHEIWEEVARMNYRGQLPGLCAGCKENIISIDVPDHPHNHPHIILHVEQILQEIGERVDGVVKERLGINESL